MNEDSYTSSDRYKSILPHNIWVEIETTLDFHRFSSGRYGLNLYTDRYLNKMQTMVEGEVTFFHDKGGYGFIDTGDEETDDVYFHMANIDGPDLEEGQVVEFEIEDAEEGPRAVNLTRVNDSEEEQDEE